MVGDVKQPEARLAGVVGQSHVRAQLRDQPGATITVDLDSQTVTGPDQATYRFDIDATHKERLLKGLDDIGLVMQYESRIEAFEKKHHAEFPWLA